MALLVLRLASSAFNVLEDSELLLVLLESVAVGLVLSALSSEDEESVELPPSRLSSGSVELAALVLGSVLVVAAVRTLLSAPDVVLV